MIEIRVKAEDFVLLQTDVVVLLAVELVHVLPGSCDGDKFFR